MRHEQPGASDARSARVQGVRNAIGGASADPAQRQRRRVPEHTGCGNSSCAAGRRRAATLPEVVKEAKQVPGFLPFGRDDAPDQIERRDGQAVFLSINMNRGTASADSSRHDGCDWYTIGGDTFGSEQSSRPPLTIGEKHDVYRERRFAGRALVKNRFFDSLLAQRQSRALRTERKSILIDAKACDDGYDASVYVTNAHSETVLI